MLARDKGNIGEDRVVAYLKKQGFSIIYRNYACKLGEIDIVAKKGGVTHFVEVKSSFRGFDPIYNFTKAKLARLLRAIAIYIERDGIPVENKAAKKRGEKEARVKRHRVDAYCIDVALLQGSGAGARIKYLENVTLV